MTLDELRLDSASKQKRGVHFILASLLIWTAILVVHLTRLPILTKNLLTFCFTAPLMPLAFLIAQALKIDFQNKENPLSKLGLIFSMNQLLYLPIAMWIYPTVPDKMLMVVAMIFGAHLLPYGWLYNSKSYYAFAVIIPFLALFVGTAYPPYILALAMLGVEAIFSLSLSLENKHVLRVELNR